MLTELDDYLCHQTVEAIEYPSTSDLRFFSRYFISFYSTDGEIAGITGIGRYANNQVMDGFALISIEGKTQRNLRVSRMLNHDSHDMRIGPVRVEMIDPLKKFRIVCEENFLGFSYDLVCETVSRPWERRPGWRNRINGRVSVIALHFNQGYRLSGTIKIDGRTYHVTPDRWLGVRDHSWGVGRFYDGPYSANLSGLSNITAGSTGLAHAQTGGPYGHGDFPVGGYYPGHNTWVPFVEGGDPCYVCFSFLPPVQVTAGEIIYPWDDARPGVHLVGIERKNVAIDERLRVFKSADLVLTDAHGEEYQMSARRIATAYELGAGYGELETNFKMGKPYGKLHVEGESWNIENGELGRRSLVGFNVAEYRWGNRIGYGSFETVDINGLAEGADVKFIPPTVVKHPKG